MSKPYSERRQFLEQAVKEIKGRVRLAEAFPINTEEDLGKLWQRVLKEGLEGLMIKDSTGHYHPAMRHWLKLKKDYLGGMADTADLIVLGSYWGTGQKGGLRTTFLMGVYDEEMGTYKTVCKVCSANTHYSFSW
jgi:DNA ligase-3